MAKKLSPEARRDTALRTKLFHTPKAALEDMLIEIYRSIWAVSAEDYPDAEVNGGDVIEAVSATFAGRRISPKEIK